ncbi:MAG: hypothetical protein ABIX09_00405 [Terrimesophilobacter sp.]
MSGVAEQRMSDDKVKAATGRIWDDWYALLDAAGAPKWDHPTIAKWLADAQGVDGWWAQGITVGYEQARGRRVPGERADGTFAVSATKTIRGTRVEILEPVLAALAKQLGEPASLRPESKYATARWQVDGETIVAGVSEPKPGSTLVAMERSRIASADELGSAKEELRKVLDAAVSALG